MSEWIGTSIVPIDNLESDIDTIELEENLSIRQIDQGELEGLLKRSLDYYPIMKQALMNTSLVIERRISTKMPPAWKATIYRMLWDETSDYIQDIAITLRLLGIKQFSLPTAFFVSANSFYISNQTPETSFYESPAVLSGKTITKLIPLLQKVKSVDEKCFLNFALKQYNRSFSENTLENVLIDYVTSFESIVFQNEKSTPRPIGPVIGIAIGMLIGKDEKERKQIRKTLIEAYELRNTIVHGHLRREEIDNNDEVIYFYDQVEEYLRRSLLKLT